MASVISKSLITPSFKGRMAEIAPGVLPSISFSAQPTAVPFRMTLLVPLRTATTDGSFRTIPSPRTQTSVLQVPWLRHAAIASSRFSLDPRALVPNASPCHSFSPASLT